MQTVDGIPFFDTPGWDPEIGIDEALDALGWTAFKVQCGGEENALGTLRSALRSGPVMVGPVEMGHLRHQPGMSGPIGADHYLVVLDFDRDGVTAHDPQGYPYARIAIADLLAAWRAPLSYGAPFTMRSSLRRVRAVADGDALAVALARAKARLDAGGRSSERAAAGLASTVAAGCPSDLRGHLIHFAVRVGARRRADAAACLQRAGRPGPAEVLTEQARLIGSLQRPLVTGEDETAATALRELAETFARLRDTLT
ncbi:hypothetical protein ACFOVU_07630 [Nocardiopsis sediminis]|uniref:Uncharacterized protein n=1 Tax=Nocardiopsis sediminis TaxID=1778267 RepID=A0ABV8FI28_9ACTN